jgi:hypothetical protein
MADISAFRAQMSRGGARSNQFLVVASFPQGLVANGQLASSKIQFLAKGASIPSADVADVPVMYRGREVHFAGERTFQPWQISVYNDNDFTVRSAFENWVNAISNADSTNGTMLPQSYQTDLEVHQLDRADQVVQKYKFVDAYPMNVSEIQLDWADNNQIQLFNVQFVYNYWVKI